MKSKPKVNEIYAEIEDGSIEAGALCLWLIFGADCDYTESEIAFILGVPRTTFYSHERRIYKKIRKEFERRGVTANFI